jgi:hypothetical protein
MPNAMAMPPSTEPTAPTNATAATGSAGPTNLTGAAAGANRNARTNSAAAVTNAMRPTTNRATPPALATTAVPPNTKQTGLAGFGKSEAWRFAFRFVRWTTYASTLIMLILIFHSKRPPVIETSPQAAARVEQKLDQVDLAVSNGQPATLHLDQTELNSYLASHLDIASNVAARPTPQSAPASGDSGTQASSGGASTAATSALAELQTPSGSSTEQIEQVRSAVKDVKVELVGDRVRAYVVFDFHGKDMSLVLEGKLGAQDGYLKFEPVSGQIGSLPIPQSTLETAVRKMMESPENREKLRLPADMSGLKIENGEVVTTYK